MKKIDLNKLKGLSKEDKLKLYDKLQAKKTLSKKNRPGFTPHEGQKPICLSQKYIRLVTAGNGFGKSALGVNEALWAVKGYHPLKARYTKAPCTGVVVLDSPLKVKEVWMKEMGKWFDLSDVESLKNGKPYVNELLFSNGSRIIFMFHEQEDLVFESLEVDWIIFDEPPPRNIFIALARGQRTIGSKPWTLIIGTPLSAAWLRQEIYEPWERGERDDVDCFFGFTEQNRKNLETGYIEQFSRLLTEDEKKIRLEGQWFDLGGLALRHLVKPQTHYVQSFAWKADDPVIIAIDPHPSKKHVAVALGKERDTDQMYVIGEISAKLVAREFAVSIIEWSRHWKVVDVVVDSLGSTDGTGGEGFKSFIEVLQECGLKCRATSFEEKEDEAWIERIRGVLALPLMPNNFGKFEPGLKFFYSCSGTIKDVENVAWLKYKNHDLYKEKLDITNKDYLACVKYALASQGSFNSNSRRHTKSKTIRLSGGESVSIRSRYMKGSKEVYGRRDTKRHYRNS